MRLGGSRCSRKPDPGLTITGSPVHPMASTKSLKAKVALNFSSTVLPMLVGLVSVPILIDGIGVERFGMLSIAWMLVGYFSLLDMGLGRALTQKVAHKIGIGDTSNLRALIFSALVFMTLLGVLGSIVLSLSAETLIYYTFNISPEYREESLKGVYWVALSIPFTILATGLFGVLEGQQHFGWTAVVRAPLGLLMFFAPVLAMTWSPTLDVIFASLFIVRVLALIALAFITLHTTKNYLGWKANANEVKSLFTFGGWITVSNIVSPVMVYFDRFYIATVLSVSVVAYYTTPVDFLTKSLLIPLALLGVMFASFSSDWHINTGRAIKNYKRSITIISAVMIPLTLIVFILAHTGLTMWLGKDFSNNSYEIAQFIAVGVLFNALALVPHALIQAAGRADITAKIHLLELPIFIIMLWYFVELHGLIGAAYAWTGRVILDAILLYSYAQNLTTKAQARQAATG